MDIHPQFFDRYETLILEPSVGHAGLSGQGAGTSPGAFTTQAHGDGYTGMGTEFEKIAHLGAYVAPLFPVTHTDAPAQPVIDLRDRPVILRDPVIVHPAAHIQRQLL